MTFPRPNAAPTHDLVVADPAGTTTRIGNNAPWWRRHIRLEDLILALWMIVVAPALSSGPGPGSTNGPDPLLGLLDLVGLLAFAACVGARSQPGVESGLVGGGDLRYAVGPLVGAIAFTLDDVGDRLGLSGSLAVLPLAAAAVVAAFARLRLSPLSGLQRRALVTPFVLVTSRFFGEVLGGLTGLFDLRQLAAALATPGDLPGTVFVVLLATVGMAIFYVMLVFAPRQIADREGTAATWAVRFLLFVVSLAIGRTVGGFLHPG